MPCRQLPGLGGLQPEEFKPYLEESKGLQHGPVAVWATRCCAAALRCRLQPRGEKHSEETSGTLSPALCRLFFFMLHAKDQHKHMSLQSLSLSYTCAAYATPMQHSSSGSEDQKRYACRQCGQYSSESVQYRPAAESWIFRGADRCSAQAPLLITCNRLYPPPPSCNRTWKYSDKASLYCFVMRYVWP